MALSFPRTMPTGGTESQSFDVVRVDFGSPSVGGRAGGITAGFPLWRMVLNLANADADETDEWRAFVPSLRGQQRLFLGRDLTRPFPKAYRGGFGGLLRAAGEVFNGTATTWSINVDRDVITLSGLPAGLHLSLNDYIGFAWTTSGSARRALVRTVEPSTASMWGVLSVTVEPALPNLVPGSAVATLAEPDCLMRLVTSETRIGEMDALHTAGGSIVGLQELLA